MKEINRNEVKDTLLGIIGQVLNVGADKVTEEKELSMDLQIDSLALYEIVVDVEERFSLRISNDEADDLSTVGEAVDFIVRKLEHS
jgi:acyl carrier protein